MKKAELTPQILRLYVGKMCTLVGLTSQWDAIITDLNVEYLADGYTVIPHLRKLSSLTEQEACELFKISRNEDWDYNYNSSLANRDRQMGKAWSCLENWWDGDYEMYAENGNWILGEPYAWLKLLEWGFDLFGLIEVGLAKEVDK